jgi:hypothetical protein
MTLYLLLIANRIHVPTKNHKKPKNLIILNTAVAYSNVLKNIGCLVIIAGCPNR